MIFVKRIDKPKILIRNEVKWTEAIQNANSKSEYEKAIGKYKNEKIKETLIEMFHGKCAFCESYIENVDFGDIEHFKPKSKFPELAVSWENLLLSCKKCNGSGQKGSNWPTEPEGGPLINPTKEDPNNFFDFEFDEKTLVAIVKPKNIRGETSEKVYGLNKSTLLPDRNRKIRHLVFIAKRYAIDFEARQIIDEAVEDSGEYAAFARMIKNKYAL